MYSKLLVVPNTSICPVRNNLNLICRFFTLWSFPIKKWLNQKVAICTSWSDYRSIERTGTKNFVCQQIKTFLDCSLLRHLSQLASNIGITSFEKQIQQLKLRLEPVWIVLMWITVLESQSVWLTGICLCRGDRFGRRMRRVSSRRTKGNRQECQVND
jgi:hypothetical protein